VGRLWPARHVSWSWWQLQYTPPLRLLLSWLLWCVRWGRLVIIGALCGQVYDLLTGSGCVGSIVRTARTVLQQDAIVTAFVSDITSTLGYHMRESASERLEQYDSLKCTWRGGRGARSTDLMSFVDRWSAADLAGAAGRAWKARVGSCMSSNTSNSLSSPAQFRPIKIKQYSRLGEAKRRCRPVPVSWQPWQRDCRPWEPPL
jgi:hypothetical protein